MYSHIWIHMLKKYILIYIYIYIKAPCLPVFCLTLRKRKKRNLSSHPPKPLSTSLSSVLALDSHIIMSTVHRINVNTPHILLLSHSYLVVGLLQRAHPQYVVLFFTVYRQFKASSHISLCLFWIFFIIVVISGVTSSQ